MSKTVTQERATASGLDNVVAAETNLSHVDGEAGRLIVAGYEVETLVKTHDFEGAVAELWRAAGAETGDLKAALGSARTAAFRLVPPLLSRNCHKTVTEGLRTGLSMLPDGEPTPGISRDIPAQVSDALRVLGAAPVFVAALCRQQEGKSPVAPDPTAGHAADFLHMLRDAEASAAEVEALNAYLVTVMDHGMNASTFTARVIAATRAGTISAVVGALCALKGPLHGGAPGPVLDMLDEIGTEANIRPWLDAAIARGDRLMGFGHRVYKVRDPRADVFAHAVSLLTNNNERLRFARKVEHEALAALKEAKPGQRLDTNMEYYTAVLLEALGIPRDAVTPVFAMARIAGWTAHVMEQERVGRLIRPQSVYVGDWPEETRAA